MRNMLFLAVAMILPAAAVGKPVSQPPPICSCDPPPQPRELPSAEALALARRIVLGVDDGAVWKRVYELIALAEQKEPQSPAAPPSRAVRAVPLLRPSDHPIWETQMHERAVDHAALAYAWRYSLDELKTMAAFFDSPAGRKFLDDRHSVGAEIDEHLHSAVLEADLWNVVCATPLPTGPYQATHYAPERLHPHPYTPPPYERPDWCLAMKATH